MIFIQNRSFQSREANLVKQYAIINDIPYHLFQSVEDLSISDIENSLLIEGSVEIITESLKKIDKLVPEPNYYPESLNTYLKRNVWQNTFFNELENIKKPIFIKSKEWKKFTGEVVYPHQKDSFQFKEDFEVYCSDLITILAEWRVYVHHQKIIAITRYDDNDEDFYINEMDIQKAIDILNKYDERVSYAIDFGINNKNEIVLIENNDAWAIGAYQGITYKEYASFLISRWSQLKE